MVLSYYFFPQYYTFLLLATLRKQKLSLRISLLQFLASVLYIGSWLLFCIVSLFKLCIATAKRLRPTTFQGAIEKSLILLSQYWKTIKYNSTIIVSLFGDTNIIFVDCISGVIIIYRRALFNNVFTLLRPEYD